MVVEFVLLISVVTVLPQSSMQQPTGSLGTEGKRERTGIHTTLTSTLQSLIVQSESVCVILVHPSVLPEGNGANLAQLSQAVTCSLPLILLTGVSLLLRNY